MIDARERRLLKSLSDHFGRNVNKGYRADNLKPYHQIYICSAGNRSRKGPAIQEIGPRAEINWINGKVVITVRVEVVSIW